MKKVMILGAGKNQLPIINICKKRGYYTIVVSVKGDYPGFALADKSYYFDTKDKDAILNVAKEEKIDAILTDQTDVAVPTVAYVAEQIGLRGIGYETALKFSNKYLMRKACQEAGIPMPEFYKVNTIEEAIKFADKIGYPVIIKPVDSSGSRGVRKCLSKLDISNFFDASKSDSSSGDIIVEKFIKGKEYLADGFAMNYQYQNLDLGIKEYFDIPNTYISKMCMFSSVKKINNRVEKMVLDTNEKIVKALGLPFGITHAEYMYSPTDDTVYLIEIAARGGGVYLSSDLTPRASGFSTNEALVDFVAEGKEIFPDYKYLDSKVASWVCFAFPEGRIRKINGIDECWKIDGVFKIDTDVLYEGMNTSMCKDDTGKYGPILILAESREETYKIIDELKKTLSIEIETSKGIEYQIW